MVINHLEKLFVTSDSATILKELEVQHPAARLLVLASKMQEEEMGDGTNLVVILAGELLVKAEELLHTGVHCSEIIAGYNKAAEVALKALEAQVCFEVDDMHDADKVAYPLRTVIASKQYGLEDFVAPMVAKACVSVMLADTSKFNTDNIRVAKILGGVSGATDIVRGMVLLREPLGVEQRMSGAKIAVYGCPIDSTATETKGTVLIKSADELMDYTKSEEAQMEATIKAIADAGINVVVCGQTIGEIALHFLNRYHILALKTPSKFELRRICRTVGATALVRLEAPKPEEIGICQEVFIREIGSTKCTILDRGDDIESKVRARAPARTCPCPRAPCAAAPCAAAPWRARASLPLTLMRLSRSDPTAPAASPPPLRR
jgi:T-complex protein 1 subunit theta